MPRHEPTPETETQVATLYSLGFPQQEVAAYIGVDVKTLLKYYRDVLDKAKIRSHTRVLKFLYDNATGDTLKKGATYADCLRANKFYCQTQIGMTARHVHEHTNPDGSMQFMGVDISKLSTACLEEIIALAENDADDDDDDEDDDD